MTREIEQVEAIQNNDGNDLYDVVAFGHDFPKNTPNDEIERIAREQVKEELSRQENSTDKERENIKNINSYATKKIDVIKDFDSKTDIRFGEKNKMIITDHNGTEVFSENVYIAVLGRFLFELDGYTNKRMKKDRTTREEEFKDFVTKIDEYQNDPKKIDDNKAFSKLFLDYIGTFADNQDDSGYLVDDYKEILAGGKDREFDIKNFMKDKRFNWYLMPLLIVKGDCFKEYLEHYKKRKKEEGVKIELNQDHIDKMLKFIEKLSTQDKIDNINVLRGWKEVKNKEEAEQIGKWFKEDVKKPCDQCLKTTAVDLQKVKVTINNIEWPLIAYLSGPLDETKYIEGKNGANQVVNFTNNEKSIISINVKKFCLPPDRFVAGVNGSFYIVRRNNIDKIDKFIVKADTFIDKYRNFLKSNNNNFSKNIDETKERLNEEFKEKYSIKKYEMSTVKDADQSIDAFEAFYEGFIYDDKHSLNFCYFGDSPEDYNFMLKLGIRLIEKNINRFKKLENKLKEIGDILVKLKKQDDLLKQQKSLLLKEGKKLLKKGKKLLKVKKKLLKKRLSGLKVVIKYNQYVHGKDKTLAQLFAYNLEYMKKVNNDEITKTEKLVEANGYSNIINARESLERMLEIQAIDKNKKVIKYGMKNHIKDVKKEERKRTSGQMTRC